jgi:hypothetical protein
MVTDMGTGGEGKTEENDRGFNEWDRGQIRGGRQQWAADRTKKANDQAHVRG